MYKGWLSNSHIGNDLVYCLLGSRVLVFVRSYELEVHANVEYLPSPSLKSSLGLLWNDWESLKGTHKIHELIFKSLVYNCFIVLNSFVVNQSAKHKCFIKE